MNTQNLVVAQLVLAANSAKNYILAHGSELNMAPVIQELDAAIAAAFQGRTIDDDARKLLGLRPHHTLSNVCHGDALFGRDCEKRWGRAAFDAVLAVVRNES